MSGESVRTTTATRPAATSPTACGRPASLNGGNVLERRGFVSINHVSEQFGKRDHRVVFVERAYYLRADGEPAGRTPYGRGYGGQTRQRRVRRPEGLVVVGPHAFGRGDRALFEGSGVVREGRREVYRAQEHVGDVVEVAVPVGSRRHAAVLVVDELRELREVLAGLLEGEERLHVQPEGFVVLHGVHAVGPAFDDRRAGPDECVHGIGQWCSDLAGDGGILVVEHDADAEVIQPGVARRRQRPGVGLRRLVLGPGGDAQRRPEVAWGSAERAHRG